MPTFTKTDSEGRTNTVVISADWTSGVQTITRPGKPPKVVQMTERQIDQFRTEDRPVIEDVMLLERIIRRLPGATAAIAAEGGIPDRASKKRDQATAARTRRDRRAGPAVPRRDPPR